MRRRDLRRSNQQFLFGIAGMALAVLLVVALFWYWCLG